MDMTGFPVLCGGTFFTLLLEAANQGRNERKKWGESSEFTESDVLEALVQVAMRTYEKTSDNLNFKSAVSAYKSCNSKKSGRLPIHNQAVIATFDNCVKNSYLTQLISMNAFVEKYIDIDGKGIWLIRALLDLVLQDENIKERDQLYVCQDGSPATKASLCGVTEVCLPALLLGIWHYIVVNKVNNGGGGETYNEWCRPGQSKNTREPFQSSIGDGITQQITLCPIKNREFVKEETNTSIKSETKLFASNVDIQSNMRTEKHSEPKSLLELLEDAIDEFYIAEFVDSDYRTIPLRMKLVVDVNTFVETMRYHLRSFRRHQDDVFKNVMSFVNMIGKYSEFLGTKMFCDDGDGRFSKWMWNNTSEDVEAAFKYRSDIDLLYGLISGGGTLLVFGYSTPEEDDAAECSEVKATDAGASTTNSQVVNNPNVFNQYGNKNIQIGSVSSLTINND